MKDCEVLKNIPETLKLEGSWCCWKYIKNDNGDIIKKPFNPLNGYGAKSNDKKTFVSYPTLVRYFESYYSIDNETGKMLGGAGLGIFNGFCAIDIDHCVDNNGELSEMAKDIVNYCNSYTELSPSKTGIRIIFKSLNKINKNIYYINNAKIGLEIYISDNTNKFVTITGNNLNNEDIKNINIQSLLDKYMKREQPIIDYSNSQLTSNNVTISLQDALQKDAKLWELWHNTAPGSHSNESELDMSLCCKLAFYLNNDFQEIKTSFESSPYFESKDSLHKNKWLNTQYATNTINGAINFTGVNIINKPVVVNNYVPAEPVKKYELNDTGNAHRFADKFYLDVHYNFDNEKWMLWNGKFWEYDVKNKIRDYVDVLAEEMRKEARNEDNEAIRKIINSNINHIQNNGGKKSLLEECQHIGDIPVLNSDFDNDIYLVCAQNMIYDLINQKALPFNRNYMMSQCLSCDIDLEHEPVRWIQFLDEIFESDKEMINYFHKICAYCISGSTREQQMWIFYGDGNNGKSLALEILSELMGSYGITSRPEILVDDKNSSVSQEEIARLKGKRATFTEEIKDGDKMNESLVKRLTSGSGKMTARFLYGNTFEFTLIAKILMASNYKPKIKGIDKGIWRRVNLVPLYRDFTATIDKDLKDKLMKELPQIAGWIVKGYKLYMEEGLDNKPEKVSKETKEYKDESDIVQTWINENCETGNNEDHTKSSELFNDFVIYCKYNQESTLTQTAWGRNMAKKFRKLTYSTGKYYIGIKLRVKPVDNEKRIAYDTAVINEDEI